MVVDCSNTGTAGSSLVRDMHIGSVSCVSCSVSVEVCRLANVESKETNRMFSGLNLKNRSSNEKGQSA